MCLSAYHTLANSLSEYRVRDWWLLLLCNKIKNVLFTCSDSLKVCREVWIYSILALSIHVHLRLHDLVTKLPLRNYKKPNFSENTNPTESLTNNMFAVMWSALVALVLLSSAHVLEVNNQTLCTLPRLFEQYKNSTCTLSYVLEKDPSTVQLYAFDVNCTQVGDSSSVPIGLPYTLHTTYVSLPSSHLHTDMPPTPLLLFTHHVDLEIRDRKLTTS